MVLSSFVVALGAGLFTLAAAPAPCDMTGYRPQPGLEAAVDNETLTVRWEGEGGNELRARSAIVDGVPTILELAVRTRGRPWTTLGRNLTPEFRVTTGVRRTGHGLPEAQRWDVFWDAPLNHPEEVRRYHASYQAEQCVVRTHGARLEIEFPGLAMGSFSGRIRWTVYRGTNLLRLEAIAQTSEPSVAYIYEGGLNGLSPELLPKLSWVDTSGKSQSEDPAPKFPQLRDLEKRELPPPGRARAVEDKPVVLRARNRLAVAGGKQGSIAFFPPPHQFFFAREIEVNLGYVWYRPREDQTFAVGVRQGESAEGYNPEWIDKVFSLYNAPPGTWQRMAVYFYLSPDGPEHSRDSVLAYTHGDKYKPVPGYKTLVTHFHTAFAQELIDSRSLDTTPPWIPMMRSLGINMAHIFDFHGDGHPRDPGPVRFQELETYFDGCRRHSDSDFLIVPGEEANAYLGGHYNILFPMPVYWTHVRGKDQPFSEDHPRYGTVYHTGSADDVFALMKREDALVWQTHPRTKGSTGYPDKIRDADYLRSDRWLGTAFKAMPVDLSQQRLGEVRCFGTLDDLNNWCGPKFMVGEVDTYKKFPDYDLYGDFNVNYVKLDQVPSFPDWSPLCRALRAGAFFVTTGEVLIPDWSVEGRGRQRTVRADVEWTFPLEFVEAVWGDGQRVGRTLIPATELPPFGTHRFRIPFDASGKKWVRFSAWDSAGNGAFTQPLGLD
jgi:hypothetical protein